MLALRSSLRCNSAFNNVLRNTIKSPKCLQIENNNHMTNVSRNHSLLAWQIQPALMNGYLVQKRNFVSKPNEEIGLDVNDDVDINDKDWQRIYYGSLTPRMRAVKVFSLTTSIAGIAAQPILLEQGMKIGGTGMAVFICGFAGFFTFVTPVLLHFITKKYVTEIHYNPSTQEYVATTVSFILQKIRTKFRPSDVKIPEVPGMFTSFNVGNRSLFVDPVLFDDPEHYVRIMGYDKPIDFKLDLKENTPASSTTNKTTKTNK